MNGGTIPRIGAKKGISCTMSSFPAFWRKFKVPYVLGFAALSLLPIGFSRPRTAGLASANAQESATPPQSQASPPQDPQPQPPQAQEPQAPASNYDKTIFLNPIPSDELADLKRFAGAPSDNLIRDKHFRKLLKSAVPDCMFHYGRDMPLFDALDLVIKGSSLPVQLRDSRYLTLAGQSGPYLSGRGFLWLDLQDGLVLGGFYFYPTNGEPTPTVNIFSRQVKEEPLALSQLPPAFVEDLNQWSLHSRVPPVTTRYFLTGSNRKILLEHDEDFCAPADASTAPPEKWCQEMNATAADLDLTAAYYLEQTRHATNATAWMITGQDQAAWLLFRDNTCSSGPDPLACHIRLTRERVRIIIRRPPIPRPLHS
jgi:uncharacterized protein YecT (DUF1311 family)